MLCLYSILVKYITVQNISLLDHDTVVSSEIHEVICTLKVKPDCRLKGIVFFGKNVRTSLT